MKGPLSMPRLELGGRDMEKYEEEEVGRSMERYEEGRDRASLERLTKKVRGRRERKRWWDKREKRGSRTGVK